MNVSDNLRKVADEFIRLCMSENVDAITLIQEAVTRNEQLNGKSTNSANEISKEDYYRLAAKVVRQEKTKRKIPKDKYLSVGIHILYIIHKKQYNTLDEFFDQVAKKLDITSEYARHKVLSCYYGSLPTGLAAFLYVFQPELSEEWFRCKLDERYEILEETEKILYEKIKAEFKNG